jgi:DNA-binding CsgD family transcriptional regulator
VGGLTGGRLATEPDPEFVAACHRATGGNPFLLAELLGELARRGIAPTAESAGQASRLSSQGVDRAVRARLRGLGHECAALARAIAVLGDPAEPALAAGLAGLDEDAAASVADMLADASILAPGRPLAFVHGLVRSSVYAELSASERAREHQRAARLLAAAGAAPDRLALHLLATSPGGDAETVATLRTAAVGAGGRGAPEVAVTYLQRALDEPPAHELMPTLAHELGAAALRAGELETAIEQLRTATHDLTDAHARADAAGALGSALFLAYRPDEAVSELSAVIGGLPDDMGEQGLRLQATRWTAARASLASWRALRERGDRFAVSADQPETPGERLAVGVAALHAVRERTAVEARRLARQALADRRLLDDPGPESAGFWIAPLVLLWSDALEEATNAASEVIDWAQRHGSPAAFAMGVRLRAFARWRRGSLADAEADATSALEQAGGVLESSSARLEHAQALLELGAAVRRAGRRAEAREPLRRALDLARRCGADAVAVRAHDELVAAGARPRRDPTESRTNLTAGELRVARLAAEGMTNREVAQALFLTENTIETHLRSVFRKLDISSRSQLARAL